MLNKDTQLYAKINYCVEVNRKKQNPKQVAKFLGLKPDDSRMTEIYQSYERLHDEHYGEQKKPNRKTNIVRVEKTRKPQDERNNMDYPFKSKVKDVAFREDKEIAKEPYVKDHRLNRLINKYSRPNYSPFPHSWECDYMFVAKGRKKHPFLVLININTRYLVVKKVKDKSGAEYIRVLEEIIKELESKDKQINYLKSDAEASFRDKRSLALYKKHDINFVFNSSKYSFHNKHVDSVIRTIRNAAGINNEILLNPNILQSIVDHYNNSPHTGLPRKRITRIGDPDNKSKLIHYSPNEMTEDLEWAYIREKDRELIKVLDRLKDDGYHSYEPGNILMVHLDNSKTPNRMKKRRRNFEDIGEFLGYKNGNVIVKMLTGYKDQIDQELEVPIFYTKKIARNEDSLTEEQKKVFIYETKDKAKLESKDAIKEALEKELEEIKNDGNEDGNEENAA